MDFTENNPETFPTDPPGIVAFASASHTLRLYNEAGVAKVLNDCVDAVDGVADISVKSVDSNGPSK